MVKVYIDTEEWYPVWVATEPHLHHNPSGEYGDLLEVEEVTWARWKRVFEDFEGVQKELKVLTGNDEDLSAPVNGRKD